MSDPTTPPPPPGDNSGGSNVPPPSNYGGSAPPPPPAYGASGGGYGAPQPHPQGTTILVLGILSIVCCAPLGPVAWYMGNKAGKEVNANPTAYSNGQSITIGKILGIIGTVLLILGAIYWIGTLTFLASNPDVLTPTTP